MVLKILGAFVLVYALTRLLLILLSKKDARAPLGIVYAGCTVGVSALVVATRWTSGTFSIKKVAIYAPALLIWLAIDWLRLPSGKKTQASRS